MKPLLFPFSALLIASASILLADDEGAAGLKRLSAEFQNNSTVGAGEIFTSLGAAPAGAGGTTVYAKSLKIPEDVDVLFVSFSAQGDSHGGSALLMTAAVNGALIQPLAGQTDQGGGGPHVQTGWYTLLILPQATTGTNCNDGGGGTGDCHDNAISFSGCIRISENDRKKPAIVTIKLATMPAGTISFYERSTIYIDGQKDEKGTLCKGAGTTLH